MRLASKPAQKYVMLPCNSPAREEWSLLPRLLEREESPAPGETSEQSATRLKALLVEAFGKKPNILITASMHRKGERNGSWLMKLFESIQHSPSATQEFYETVGSRLLMPQDGSDRETSEVNQAKGRGSSYRMLDYWDPHSGGMIPYLRFRIGHIMNQVKREKAEANRLMVSVGRLEDFAPMLDGEPTAERTEASDAYELYAAGLGFSPTAALFDTPEQARIASIPPDEAEEHQGGYRVLGALLDSLQNDGVPKKPVLHNPLQQEALEALGVDLTLWHQSQAGVARYAGPETEARAIRRIALERDVAVRLIEALGGPETLPEDLAARAEDCELVDGPDAPDLMDAPAVPDERPLMKKHGNAQEPADFSVLAAHARAAQPTPRGLASATRPEYALFSAVLAQPITPAESPEARAAQLRRWAFKVVADCPGLNRPEDHAAGVTVEEAISEWDPSAAGFGRAFPDVIDYLEQRSLALQPVLSKASDPKVVAPSKKDSSKLKLKAEENGQLSFLEAVARGGMDMLAGSREAAIDFAQATADFLDARSFVKTPETMEEVIRSPDFQEALAVRNARESGFWRSVCHDPAGLDSSDRPDYQFLCSKLGVEPSLDLPAGELHAAVGQMAKDWVAKLNAVRSNSEIPMDSAGTASPETRFRLDLAAMTQAYNPAEDGFFGQALTEFMCQELAQEKSVREEVKRQAKVSPLLVPVAKAAPRRARRSSIAKAQQPTDSPAPEDLAALRRPVEAPCAMPTPGEPSCRDIASAGMDI